MQRYVHSVSYRRHCFTQARHEQPAIVLFTRTNSHPSSRSMNINGNNDNAEITGGINKRLRRQTSELGGLSSQHQNHCNQTNIHDIPSMVILELIFVYLRPHELTLSIINVCQRWHRLLTQSCLTLERFWRYQCLTLRQPPSMGLTICKTPPLPATFNLVPLVTLSPPSSNTKTRNELKESKNNDTADESNNIASTASNSSDSSNNIPMDVNDDVLATSPSASPSSKRIDVTHRYDLIAAIVRAHVMGMMTSIVPSIHRTGNISRYICDRSLPFLMHAPQSATVTSSSSSSTTPTLSTIQDGHGDGDVATKMRFSWRHRIVAQHMLWDRWRQTDDDDKLPIHPKSNVNTDHAIVGGNSSGSNERKRNKKTHPPRRRRRGVPYTSFHRGNLGEVSSWSLMCDDRFVVYLVAGVLNVLSTDTMMPPSQSLLSSLSSHYPVPLDSIKLPVSTPDEHGWTVPLSSSSAWLVMSFGSCMQMVNIMSGQSYHNLSPSLTNINTTYDHHSNGDDTDNKHINDSHYRGTKARRVPSRSMCVADGNTSQPIAITFAKPSIECWDIPTMTFTTPWEEWINGGDNIRFALNDNHSMIAIADLDHELHLIDRRSNHRVDDRTQRSSNLAWRDNLLVVGGPLRSNLFDMRKGLKHPIWQVCDNRHEFVAVDINSNGMMVFHNFFSNETDLYDLYRLDGGIVRTWANSISDQMSQPMLTYDKFYLLGYHDAIVYDYSRSLISNIHESKKKKKLLGNFSGGPVMTYAP
jgi:hypothetical protein